jgi:hypothetical protein
MHLELAYIDPGSGSLIIQAVIATVIAIPFFLRHHIARFMRLVRHQDEPTTDAGSPGDSTR